ncbi:hypothetical protein L2E82_14786 [Cichorium intybus]|uniref:Uncharacterized protein n=1 Tax=Cichorium intybus TaxID=13427 RepID=A0ACB9F1E2_CICIN|nr:hypothetical protein L2E82_14786 [Cichorium intybus]
MTTYWLTFEISEGFEAKSAPPLSSLALCYSSTPTGYCCLFRFHLRREEMLQIIFVFGDHIRKGAAPNDVQIAKMLLEANMFCLTR